MAGQNADMTLKVGLDLNFFRQELQKASSSLAGQPIDINIRFNKKGIADQYRLLTRYLGGKKSFDVKIESNTLNELTNKVANFQKTLKNLKDEKVELSINASANIEKFSKEKIRKIRAQIRRDIVSGGAGEIQLPTKLAAPNVAAFVKVLAKQAQVTVAIKNGTTGKEARNVLDAIEDRIQSDQKIKQGGGKLRVPTSIKASINNADVSDFKKAVNEKLGSIAIKIKAEVDIAKTPAQIQAEVARKMQDIARMGAERMSGGGVTESARREQFRTAITGEGIGSLKNIAKQVGVGGYSKYKSDTAAELINKLVQEASIEAITKYLDPQAVMRNPDRSGLNKVLDTFARGLLQMLGMDPATIRREMQQRRALPGVNFPSTIPPRNIPIGPSGTGRALPPGAIASALPGTAFGAQKYLPTGLSNEMQSIMRSAAYAFVDSIKQQIRNVRIGLAASQQPLLGPSRIAGLLPAGVGRAPSVYSAGAVGGETRAEMMARREREARMRSDLRGMDVIGGGAGRTPSPYSYAYRGARPTSAIVPYAAGGAIVPQSVMAQSGTGGGMQPPSGGGGLGGFGGMRGFGRAIGGINLPGTGVIQELGQEFAFATKQVVLFGQAYKLLAFIQNLPAQVGAAVGQLQSFRNTLNAVTPSAEEARASNELLLGLMEKYNVPLQSARDGFTKLYASMAPAGFNGDEIRDLFTGITKAAATFGMSADKVDRVNYAFAQMASKGQVMSEELKGQLGDVLPGAMALFAEAAGFKGPKAIQDFSAALEDGAYKGEAMVALLKNVTVVMNKEFGPGAEGAALTFQGVMNRMQNSMTLFYEAFEPVAVGFLNTVVVPMTNGIKQLTDGLNAFFTGTAAKTAGGFAIAQELERLRPAFDGIGQNVQKLLPVFQQFANVALNVAKIFLEIAGNPFVGYLLRVYAAVLPLTLAIQALNLQALIPMIASFLRAIPAFVAYTAATAQGVTANKALQLTMQVTGSTATVTAGQIRSVGVAIKAAFTGTLVLAAVTGIGMIIEKIISLNAQMADTRAKALGAAQAIRSMSQTEARQAAQQYEAGAQSLKALNEQVEQGKMKGKAWIEVTGQQAKALQDAGIIVSNVRGSLQVQPTRIPGAFQKLTGLGAEARYREREINFREQQAQIPAVIAPISTEAGDEKSKTKEARKNLDELVNTEILKLSELEKANIKLDKAQTEAMAPDTAQAKRMLDYYEEFRNNLVDIQAIQAQLQILERNRAQYLKLGFKSSELDERTAELRNQLAIATIDLATTEQEYRNRAKKDAADEAEEMQKRLDQQRELNRLLEDAAIASGAISARQAGVITQRRGFEDQMSRARELGATPEQLSSLGQLQSSIPEAGSLQEKIQTLRQEFEQLASWEYQAAEGAMAVGTALGEALTVGVTGLISGTTTAKEVFANFLKSVGQALSQAASQMIATYIAIGIAKLFAGLGGGGFKFSGQGPVGLPGALNPLGGADVAGNFAPNLTFANGGIAPGGFRAFANGGVVSGPTLGLVGEGRYNEAIVPLPDGKSIPVQFSGERSARDMMSRNAQVAAQASPINLSFETTKIGNTEYVSRDQLEAAMAETRRAAINGGAARGMSMTLDRIQQSPSVRSRIGIR